MRSQGVSDFQGRFKEPPMIRPQEEHPSESPNGVEEEEEERRKVGYHNRQLGFSFGSRTDVRHEIHRPTILHHHPTDTTLMHRQSCLTRHTSSYAPHNALQFNSIFKKVNTSDSGSIYDPDSRFDSQVTVS
jgi:hypothetical protein